jgi:hypothetical protein
LQYHPKITYKNIIPKDMNKSNMGERGVQK